MRLERDPDVLDTWFSSALWAVLDTLGWPRESERLARFYPTRVLVTGFDIIFFWVARMVMMGVEFMDDVPFDHVYIHGLVLDADGEKMSKSKGNILDPLDLIDGIDLEPLVVKRTTGLMKPEDAPRIAEATRRQFPDGIPAYGTDALRFTFCSLATKRAQHPLRPRPHRREPELLQQALERGPLVLRSAGPAGEADPSRGAAPGPGNGREPPALPAPRGREAAGAPTVADRWIRSRLAALAEQVRDGFETYRFDYVAGSLYDFTWNEFCDW